MGKVKFMQNALFEWFLNNTPGIAICLALMWLTGWVIIRITNHQNRLSKAEADTEMLKKDVKGLKKAVRRIEQKVNRLELKLDKLITYLTATRNIDFKD